MYLSYTFNKHFNTYSQQYQHQLGQDFDKTLTEKQYWNPSCFLCQGFNGGSRDCWDCFGLLINLQQSISSSQVPCLKYGILVSYIKRKKTGLIWYHPHHKLRIMSCFQVSATDETVKINNVHPVTKNNIEVIEAANHFQTNNEAT